MAEILRRVEQQLGIMDETARKGDRRTFLKWAGATAALFTTAGSLGGCNDDTVIPTPGVTLTNDDTGVLTYAYVLEQLEAAFYTQVAASFYSGATADEKTILTDIRDHEIAHREFFQSVLGTSAVVEVDFSSIDFTSRTSVLNAAKTFEDLGVAAYNGAGKLLASANNLLLAGKIVSVEARHAAIIRDLIAPKNETAGFSGNDIPNFDATNRLDAVMEPAQVLAAADVYITTTITNNLGA